MPFPDHAVT